MAYLGKTPSQAVRSRYYFTATGGETSLSGTDDNSNTLTFTDGNYVDVALNGVTLVAGTDYNTTTANTIGGLTALVASDVVEVIVYDTFSVFGGNMAANLNFKDNVKANFGTGNDLQIYHDGSASNIRENGTGNLQIWGDDIHFYNSAGSENIATFITNGAVKLFYDNAQKLATTATGIDVTGTVTADSVGVGAAPNATFGSLLYTQGTPAVNKPIVSAYSQGNSNNAGFALFNDSGNRGIWTTGSTMRFTRTYEGNSTADVTIDASGNLLVGTTDSTPIGSGGTAITSDGRIDVSRNGGLAAQFERRTSDGNIVAFIKDGSTVGSIGVDNTDNLTISGNSSHCGLNFSSNDVNPYKNGAYTDGTTSLGSSSTRFNNLYLSGGVYLGGTGSADYLDDYEEGTWIPTFQASVSDPTVAYSGRAGYYTKVGSLVTVWCSVSTNSVSGGSGSLKITGLPFTEITRNTGYVVAGTWSVDHPMCVRVVSGAAFLYSRTGFAQSDLVNNIQVSDMSSASGGYNGTEFTVSYRVS